MKALSILETPYRATLEEQHDSVIWFARSIRRGGGDVDLLLRNGAVNYVVARQDASGLAIGDVPQTEPPRIPEELRVHIAEGARVYVVAFDLSNRGIVVEDILEGVTVLSRDALPDLFARYDVIWHW